MLSDVENVRKMVELLSDEGFVRALTNAEQLVDDVDETLGRVEQVEDEAAVAVREANEALNAVDRRLQRFDEAIRLIEAKIEAGFSVGFFFFAFQQWTAGDVLLAAGLSAMGLLGISSLAVTIATMPQIQRLRQVGGLLTSRLDVEDDDREEREDKASEPSIDWQTTDQHRDREPDADRQTDRGRRHQRTGESHREREADQSSSDQQAGESHRDQQTRGTDPDGQAAESGRASSDDQRAESGRDRQRDRTTDGRRRNRGRRRDQAESEARERTGPDDDRGGQG